MRCINLGRTSLKAETWNAQLEWCVYKSLLPTLPIQRGRGVSGLNWQMVQWEEGWSFWSCCTVWLFLSFFPDFYCISRKPVAIKEWGLSSGHGAFYKMTFKAAGRLVLRSLVQNEKKKKTPNLGALLNTSVITHFDSLHTSCITQVRVGHFENTEIYWVNHVHRLKL